MFIPPHVSDYAAAAFPCPSLTAWQAVQKIPKLHNRDVLVNGAGGSVGYLLTQLLLEQGARVYVTALVKHHQELHQTGVINAFDYKNTGWKAALQEQMGGKKLDVVFDTVSGNSASLLVDLLGYYGHVVSIQDRIATNPLPAFTTCISLHEIALGAFHEFASDVQVSQLMAEGEKLLFKIGQGVFKQRQLVLGEFEHLNVILQEMKARNSSDKYVIKLT